MREEMFRRTDQDRGGTITKEELTNGMSERGPSSAGVNIDQLFSQIDANEDGSIDGAGAPRVHGREASGAPECGRVRAEAVRKG